MKKNRIYRNFLACILAVFTVMTTLVPPVIAEAESGIEQEKKVVFSIDAGRKFFDKEELESLINKASECGYTDFQLILGNDGLRFLLDDMSVKTNYGMYSDSQVREAISEGNRNYYDDPNGNYLTQSELDEIMNFAKKKNIKIIPVINSPGHMDSMLYGMEQLGIEKPAYDGSIRTVDLSNDAAVAFTRAVVNKYIEYFSGNCEIFNIGCDEYANDIDNGGWEKLEETGKYKDFIKYVNLLAKDVKAHGMIPMCFNDGIYYDKNDNFGEFDKDIIISYWNSGWVGYNPAPASYLVEKGHKILNTNQRWYWVVGNFKKRDYGNVYTYKKAENGAKYLDFNSVSGGRRIPTIGSMQCVWYDYPQCEYDHNLVIRLMDLFSYKNRKYMRKAGQEEHKKKGFRNRKKITVPVDILNLDLYL